jgi:lipopolysaccharide transport system ATP-binding protein
MTVATSVVTADRLTKVYRIYDTPWGRLREAVLRRPAHRPFEALRDVSFELPPGDGLGVVGENGAGKSTLLKIVAGVTRPTAGELSVRGRVASILELGSGFHHEFTGRQNIRLSAAIVGLDERELRERTRDIVEFSELGAAIDQPVRSYSTGMTMRLGFSIAVQVEPDILVVDEALSVGDGYFQKKCMDRLQRYMADGGTLLFCSHAMYYVTSFCQQALWLREGQVAAEGPALGVVGEYERFLMAKTGESTGTDCAADDRAAAPARILGIRPLDGGPHRRASAPWALEVEWESRDDRLGFHLAVGLDSADGVQVCAFTTQRAGLEPMTGAGRHRAVVRVPRLPMTKGDYSACVFLLDEESLHVYDRKVQANVLEVEAQRFEPSLFEVAHEWEVDG